MKVIEFERRKDPAEEIVSPKQQQMNGFVDGFMFGCAFAGVTVFGVVMLLDWFYFV